jgi:outer membrane murein-binding lipoprotein Lpp
MSLNASKSRLSALTKDLNAKWRSTRESWRDQRALEFEKQYMDELLSSVSTALNQIDKLEQTLNHIRRDCE